MPSHARMRNVGAIDPELRTSPVIEETAEDADALSQLAPDAATCWFNGEMFATGELIRSGSVVLQCSRGVWVEIGPGDPGNP
jgi:2-keto-4-pentenoate hydratase